MEFNSSADYNELSRRLIYKLAEKNIGVEFTEELHVLDYQLDSVKVEYNNIENGFFGPYDIDRKVSLSGSYFLKNKLRLISSEKFNLVHKDTINYDNLPEIEDLSKNYSKGVIPKEPFLRSVLVPFIALTTAAVSTIFFFFVRSK